MIIKYTNFKEKLSESKIFSEEIGKEKEIFKSDSIDMVFNCKNYKHINLHADRFEIA